SSIAKDTLSKVVTVIGGAHASADPAGVLSNAFVDYIFKGEAERGFSYFLKNFFSPDRLKAPGLGYRSGNDIIQNEPELVDDLDSLAFPDYKKMQLEKYPKMYFMKNFPAAPIMSSRGCPFDCTFCAGHKVSGRKWRSRSVNNIIEEIEYLRKGYGIREVDFWDDNFTLNKARVEEFCKALKALDADIIWWCPNGVHLNTLDRDLLVKMKEGGCYAIAFGVESGSERIQKDIKKRISFEKLKDMVEFSYKIGLRTQGFFILGYPTEREEDILETIKLSISLPFLRASFLLFQPIIGSEICGHLMKEKLLDEKDHSITTCDYSKVSITTQYIKDTSRIKQLQRRAILSFYLRPRIFFRLVFENLSLSQIKELIVILKRYIIEK
ncbi:MAG: B12-binding domain-containing radical SAM protein, partial [Candidatus Omnitrophica bacterium]|nr:B12-binding domain-containing radical SAM protein [Candidatus Omnitrophota bacterium]